MENASSQQPYHDSPTSSRSSPPIPHIFVPSIQSLGSSATIRPLPELPSQVPAYEPYRDDPTTSLPYQDDPPTPTNAHHDQSPAQQQRHTDNTPLPTPTASDDNIPLAYLLSQPYPSDAPPSYSVAVRQTHSHRDTLIEYIPQNPHHSHNPQPPTSPTPYQSYQQRLSRSGSLAFALDARSSARRQVVIDIDEESGEVVSRTDDVRHGVEKCVAMFVVAGVLLCLSAVLGWMAFGW